jgi:hypothetical protein
MAALRLIDLATPPGWAVAAVLAILVLLYIFSASRLKADKRGGALSRIIAALIAGVVGWWCIDQWGRHDFATERRAVDARALELTAQATRPGSTLACLDAIAGELVEQACEAALFASPQATAAAVSYVAAQLALLASGGQDIGRGTPSAAVVNLRRAVEADTFGIVAHVLATRDGCTPDQCAVFSLLQDASRISANLAERPFDARVKIAMANWPAVGDRPPLTASAPPASAAPSPVAAARVPNNLYFPSSASIPPVNIMTAEPSSAPQQAPHDTTGAAAATPLPPRRPPPGAAPERPAQGAANAPARPALTPPAPTAQ